MVIETMNLTKLYDDAGKGCRQINLSVAAGRLFGFLGPNGAGKSTLVKILVGLLFPTSGKALLLGRPLGDRAIRARIGFLPENFRFPPWLTANELLRFHASLYRLDQAIQGRRIPEVLKLVGLLDAANHRTSQFSKGMLQRLGIAIALLAEPQLVFLDEPTSALDPIGRREIREILLNLKAEGTTVFLNSHLLSEVEMVCDQVAFIKSGRIIAAGNLAALLQSRLEIELKIGTVSPKLQSALEELGEVTFQDENRLLLRLFQEKLLPRVAQTIVAAGAELYELTPRRLSLEDLFFQFMNEDGEV